MPERKSVVLDDVKLTAPIDAPAPDPTPVEPVAKAADVASAPEQHDAATPATEIPAAEATSGASPPERVKSPPTKATARTPVTPSKSKPIAAKSTPKAARTPAKSPPSSFNALSASTSTPAAPSLKSSVSSPASKGVSGTARPRPSSSAGHRPPVTPAKTPLRAKTPTGIRPKTPSASTPLRAKSPATTVKTPSSGLFAPTAASLARARNAPEPVPPVRKQTLSTAATERLSKPTAASLSKARAPTLPPQTKATPTKTPVKGSPVTRGTGSVRGRGAAPTKARGGAPAAKGKEEKTVAKSTVEAPTEDVHPQLAEDEPQEVEVSSEHIQEGSANTSATLADEHADGAHAGEFTHEPEVHDDVAEEKISEQIIHDEPHEDAGLDTHEDVVVDESVSQTSEPENVEPAVVNHASDVEVEAEAQPEKEEDNETDDTHVAEAAPHKSQDELDDIVSMLESKPLFSSVHVEKDTKERKSGDEIDVAGEIPDEE